MIRPAPATRLAAVLALCIGLVPMPAAAAPRVVTDIAPIQSIVARVMSGMGEPEVLLPPGASPHGYSLRPSDARRLEAADLVVWVGPALTPWLAGPIAALAPQASVLELEEAPGVILLPTRADAAFEAHVHADGEDEHELGHELGHGHEPGGEARDHEHTHDGHLWLDPGNAVASARAIAAALGAIDPAGAAGYAANAEGFASETAALERAIAAELAPVRGRPYLVFHDAYQYFERSFELPAAGSVALQEGVTPG
ncbi:MAG TPA: zinc ABC transporter substrate-binding protein, partial [Amaricoccus sp.]|nr:zinc ABC transporter substrate-binding protein [Amaricoccus sp.]